MIQSHSPDLPDWTYVQKDITWLDAEFNTVMDLKHSVFPIMKAVDDRAHVKEIIGTAFLIVYLGEYYIVTTRHVVIPEGDSHSFDYIFGFEGNNFHGMYFFYKEDLEKLGLKWLGLNRWEGIRGLASEVKDLGLLDLVVAKIQINAEVLNKINVKPIKLTLDNYLIGAGDKVFTFGFPLGIGARMNQFELSGINVDIEKVKKSTRSSLYPVIFSGEILYYCNNPDERIFQIISRIPGAGGMSGGPLINIRDGIAHLMGINYKAPVEKIVLNPIFTDTPSTHNRSRYTGKIISIHFSHLIDILSREEFIQREPTTLTGKEMRIELRDLIEFTFDLTRYPINYML